MNKDIGFILPELIFESIIRDGILNIRENPEILDSLFAQLLRTYNSRKYGQAEIDKIRDLLIKRDIAVCYSYNEIDEKSPCFSIMVGIDDEDRKRAHLDDHYEDKTEPITDPNELTRVDPVVPLSWDIDTGILLVDDSTDLSTATKFMVFVDAADVEHEIKGISDEPGNKFLILPKRDDVDVSDTGIIRSTLDFTALEIKGVTSDDKLVIGCHSKDALLTKYMYVLLKYFVVSRKKDIILRGFYNISFSGSDFSRDSNFMGDRVTTRFLTVMGKIDDRWRSDQITLIDDVVIDAEPIEKA